MTNKHRFFTIMFILFLGCFLMSTPLTWAQPMTHVVQKGDTLWDLCETYYGDPDLWPQLWQINQFVTNPHLLKPGDIITLLEDVPVQRPVEEKIDVSQPEKVEPVAAKTLGIDVSGFTNVNALGYLSDVDAEPWGDIFASENNRMLMSPGDTVFVRLTKQTEKIKPGDEFSICRPSPLIKHPVTGEKMGYVLTVRGRLVIQEPVGQSNINDTLVPKKNIYQARLLSSYRTLSLGDLIIPYEPISPCVIPISMEKQLLGNIVATQDETNIIATDAVVYIDHGFEQGVHRGEMFQVIRRHIVSDPDDKGFRLTKRTDLVLPDIPIGTIIVLESRPNTATALVLFSKEEFLIGSYIKGLSWTEAPEIFSKLASCPVE